MKMFGQIGSKWSKISKKLKGRPENAVKNRFYSFIRKNYELCEKGEERELSETGLQEGVGGMGVVLEEQLEQPGAELFEGIGLPSVEEMPMGDWRPEGVHASQCMISWADHS